MGKEIFTSKSKFRKKNLTSIYRILTLIHKKHYYGSRIARALGMSRQLVGYYLKKLEKEGLIKRELRTSFISYQLTEKGKDFHRKLRGVLQSKNFSLPTMEELRLHNLAIKFPLLKDNPEFEWERANDRIRNWVERYKTFPQMDITLKKTTRSIILYLHQFNAKDYSEFLNRLMLSILAIYSYLKRHDIDIDIFNAKVISQHLAITMNRKLEESIKKVIGNRKVTIEKDLNRKAKSIYPSDLRAKAWIDWRLGRMELGTNDLEYMENFILMPERVRRFEKLGEFIIQHQ